MSDIDAKSDPGDLWPWLAMAAVLALAVCGLRIEGRLWWCACGRPSPWAGDTWSAHNSQHLFDPYTCTHLLHGFLLCGLLTWGVPRLSRMWRFCLAVSIEALWEVVENSDFIIQRYRQETALLHYQGDTIFNSLGDIAACGIGFALAGYLGFRRSLALFAVIEITLLAWIRDSLVLDTFMLVCPVEAIKAWQMGH